MSRDEVADIWMAEAQKISPIPEAIALEMRKEFLRDIDATCLDECALMGSHGTACFFRGVLRTTREISNLAAAASATAKNRQPRAKT